MTENQLGGHKYSVFCRLKVGRRSTFRAFTTDVLHFNSIFALLDQSGYLRHPSLLTHAHRLNLRELKCVLGRVSNWAFCAGFLLSFRRMLSEQLSTDPIAILNGGLLFFFRPRVFKNFRIWLRVLPVLNLLLHCDHVRFGPYVEQIRWFDKTSRLLRQRK